MPADERDRSNPRSGRGSRYAGRPSGCWGRAGDSSKSRRERPSDERILLYGWHSVRAALENPQRRIRKLLLTKNAARRLSDEGVALPVEPALVSPEEILAYLPPDAVHQGLLAEADPLPSLGIEDIGADGILVVLDQITDPHNVGAILRSAAAFGANALVTTSRHSPEATGALAKAASGALEFVPIIAVGNLARALGALKARGVLVMGLDGASPIDLADETLTRPLALVFGAEGKGLRQLTRATCDRVARLVLPGQIKTLNVSNAAALALYIAAKGTPRLGNASAPAPSRKT